MITSLDKLTSGGMPNFRYVEEVVRYLSVIDNEVDDLAQLLQIHNRSVTKGIAGFTFKTVDTRGADHENKPPVDMSKKPIVLPMDKMAKSYSVLQNLTDKLRDLQVVEVQLATDFKDVDSKKALNALKVIRVKIERALKDAGQLLQNIAEKHVPKQFTKLCAATATILEEAIQYETVHTYMYVYTKDGLITFSRYYELHNALDADGKTFNHIVIVASCQMSDEGRLRYYMNTLNNFVVPGRFPLGKPIASEGDKLSFKHLQTVMSMILAADSFSSGIERLPLATIINPNAVKPSVFSYHKYIDAINFEEDRMVFVLKKTVKQLQDANKVASSLFVEINGTLTRKTGIKLRMSISTGNPFEISFSYVRTGNHPSVSIDDLEFLKDRFGVSDTTLKEVQKLINLDS